MCKNTVHFAMERRQLMLRDLLETLGLHLSFIPSSFTSFADQTADFPLPIHLASSRIENISKKNNAKINMILLHYYLSERPFLHAVFLNYSFTGTGIISVLRLMQHSPALNQPLVATIKSRE